MKKAYKLCAAAAVVMLCVSVLAGCGESKSSPAATPTPTSTQNQQQADKGIKSGDTYRYLVWNVEDPEDPFKNEEEFYGTAMSQKKSALESQYGIKIEYVKSPGNNWAELAMEAAYTGKPLADIINMGGNYNVLRFYNYNNQPGLIMGALSDYSEYADFNDEEYWDTALQETCTFNDKLYFCVPKGTGIGSIYFNMVTFFNKDAIARGGYSAEQLYELNESGEWTWEKFYEVAADCNDPDNEYYGALYTQDSVFPYALMASNGANPLKREAETGNYVYNGNDNKVITSYDFLAKLFKDNIMGIDNEAGFATGKYALALTYLCKALDFTASSAKPQYGIMMPPKGPDAQDYSSMVNWFVPIGMFKEVANPSGTAQLICEYLRPAWGASSEENKASFDAEMLLYIQDEGSEYTLRNLADKTMAYEIGIYSNAVADTFSSMVYLEKIFNESTTPAQHFASMESKVNEALKLEQGIR